MKAGDTTDGDEGADAAARRFVRADAGSELDADAVLATWLAARPANERALQRVELAVELGRRLAADPNSGLYTEAGRAAQRAPRRMRSVGWLVWGGALAAALVVAAFVVRDRAPEPADPEPLAAARRVAFDAPSNAVTVLPSGVVIDASAVAVLPFVGSGDAALAAGFEHDVATALRTVPGLYVIADDAVRPYADTDLAAAEIGGLLGARGLVDASIELVVGRVRVSARLREAATGATLWQTQVDRPVDELAAVRTEIAENVTAAMFDSSLRAQAAPSGGTVEPTGSAKPFQQ